MKKKFFSVAIFALVFLTAAVVSATCFKTVPGLAFVNGHRINFWRFGRQFIETNCTARQPGFVWWRGGVVCEGRFIFYQNVDGSRGWCKVRKIRA